MSKTLRLLAFGCACLGLGLLATACRPNVLSLSSGIPKVELAGASGATTATAAFPNPCEIDLDFGEVAIGLIDSATVQIHNVGSGPLDLSQVDPTLDPEFGLDYGNQQPLTAGSSSAFSVTFQPYKTGLVQSTFAIQTDGLNGQCPAVQGPSAGDAVTVKLTGTGIQLSLAVQPIALDFGWTLLNTTATKSVTLTNTSTALLTGLLATVGGADAHLFTVDNAPSALGPGASMTVNITYAPLALEVASVAIASFSAPDGEKANVKLYGAPIDSALVLAPNPIDFGYVALETSAIGCSTVSNLGSSSVSVSGVSGFDDEAGAFAIAATDDATPPNPIVYPIAIAGGASAKICFTLTPPISQQYSGQATLTTNAAGSASPVVQLGGWGGGPQLPCLPTSIAFGETLTHSTATASVLCTNTGSAIPGVTLTIEPPSASPSVFSAQFDPARNPYPLGGLAPGQSVRIDVTYTPTATASDKGALLIKSNAGRGQTLSIPLDGQGLNAAPCQALISPLQLDFGNVQAGDTSQVLSFEVQNLGADVCLVHGLGITNDATSAFHVLTTSIQPDPLSGTITIPPPAVNATSGLTISLDFAPIVSGAFSAEAIFTISDPADPNQLVPLLGTSASTCLVIAPPALNFGEVGESDGGMLCTSTGRSFSIFNECNTAATVKSFTVQSGPGDLVPQFSTPAGGLVPPFTLQPGDAPAVFQMFFEPSTLGTHTGQVLISDGMVETVLPVTGEAVSTGIETDTFVVGPPGADILFILDVDDDPGARKAIEDEIPAFLAAAGDIDYRLAMTTDSDTPGDPTAESGHLLPCPTCSTQGTSPTIVSPSSVPAGGSTPDPAAVFNSVWKTINATQAYDSDPYTGEQMFLALYNALQHGPQPGVDFFREGVLFAAINANSESEDDSSQEGKGGHDTTWYANYFKTYFGNPFLFSWNYVLGAEGYDTGSTGTGFTNPLELGNRVAQMLSATGGISVNPDDPNWPTALASIWSSAIAVHASYPLSGKPAEGQNGIVVRVNGTIVSQLATSGEPDWTYQSTIDAVLFNASVFVPVTGDKITVTYPIGCNGG